MLKPVHAVLVAALLSSAAFDAAVAAETTAYSYDARGRLVTVVRSGGPAGSFTSSYAIDDADNRTQVAVTQNGTVAPSFSVANARNATEGTPLVLEMARDGGSGVGGSGDYATSGSATSGSEFTTTSGALTFSSAETTPAFSAPTASDRAVEASESVLASIAGAAGGATAASATEVSGPSAF